MRTFEVHVEDQRRSGHWVSYPAAGLPLFAGHAALAVMRRFMDERGFPSSSLRAVTSANDITESLSVEEMEEAVLARQYRVVWVRDDKKTKGILFPGPLTHDEACACLSKLTRYPWRREQLEEIT